MPPKRALKAKAKSKVKGKARPAVKAQARRAAPPTTAQLDSLALLHQLSETVGVSGDEGAVRKIIVEQIAGLADEVKVDSIGNVFAIKHGPARAPRVLVAAHMDEVGFMIVGIDSDGQLKFEAVGGIDDRIVAGKAVWVGADKVPGVIGMKPIHLTTSAERDSVAKIESLRIDIGATSREGAARLVRVGDRATFAVAYAEHGDLLRGKAFDDRAGCAILVDVLRGKPYPVELICAFTVQEEVGLRGAKVAGYTADPQAAIAIDCTPASDLPSPDEDDENTRYNTRLGLGAAIYTADGSTLHDKRLIDHLAACGSAKNIPYQFRQPGGGGTDAAAFNRARAGVPTVSVSVPGRYLHSPAALIHPSDFHNTARLVRAALEGWSAAVLKR